MVSLSMDEDIFRLRSTEDGGAAAAAAAAEAAAGGSFDNGLRGTAVDSVQPDKREDCGRKLHA